MLPCTQISTCANSSAKITETSKPVTWAPLTFTNLFTFYPSSIQLPMLDGKAGASITHYSGRIVDEILDDIFAERRGFFPETSSTCKVHDTIKSELHVDKRLRYWHEVLAKRQEIQKRLQIQTGKSAQEILFNRRSTFDNRNKETMVRLLDYADRMKPEKLSTKPVSTLEQMIDPDTCNIVEGITETWPKAEQENLKDVEIIGIPSVIQKEMMGTKTRLEELPNSWMQSEVLQERIEQKFEEIHGVLEFFPDLNTLQVKGTKIEKTPLKPTCTFVEEDRLLKISSSNPVETSEYDELLEVQETQSQTISKPEIEITEPDSSEAVIPEIGLKINGKDYIVEDKPFTDCFEMITKFKCDPFQKRIKHILQLTNIGKQTLSFNWQQGVYFYNRPTLLLAQDDEFLFDTDSFRLTHGQSYNLIVMYQPRKVRMAMELWRLQSDPKIFCSNQGSLQLRFHGRCTPPQEYMNRLNELQAIVINKSNAKVMTNIMNEQASLAPLIVPPATCCAYERTLDERELFNSFNPGYNCQRFDDLEVFKAMHKQLKKPREPQWDLRLDTLKMLIMRLESVDLRKKMFANFMVVLEPLLGGAPSLDSLGQLEVQKQRTRLIYVRGAICNGIEEWEDLMLTIEESFFKSEMQQYFINQLEVGEEEEEEGEGDTDIQAKIAALLAGKDKEDNNVLAEVQKSLRHSKFFRDALYIQTYSHLCNIAENIVSVIESTEDVPN
ncbi:uncharacterized protein LOC117571056 [Drosophila albomicans]|uniref:Uncharacterized protein LOC117571056 n=1 Tax=Drosophila albomicans TaxID=7291 RepID=A0A6P8WYR6_DROAB|nr:uncharacterized protein LOC117571056 [Drosophila albomicans]